MVVVVLRSHNFQTVAKNTMLLGFMPLIVITKFIRETYLSKLMRLFTFKHTDIVLHFPSQVMSKIRVVAEICEEKLHRSILLFTLCTWQPLNTVRFSALPVRSVSQFSDICLSLSHSSGEGGTGFYKENMSMKTQRVSMKSAVGSVIGWCFTFIYFRGGCGKFKQTVYSRECFFAVWEHKTPHKSTGEIFKSKSWKNKNLG